MFVKKPSIYAGLERRDRPNCIREKCVKCSPKAGVGGSNPFRDAKNSAVSLDFTRFTAFFYFDAASVRISENRRVLPLLLPPKTLLIGFERFSRFC